MCTAAIIDINAIVDILHAENGDRIFQLSLLKHDSGKTTHRMRSLCADMLES